jgi:peptide/nickel transport system substrate-binding protein
MTKRWTTALLLALALTACGWEPVPDDVLVVGQVAEPRSLDPHAVTALNDFRILVNLYEGLVRFAPGSLEVEPALAQSWTVSEDGLTYTFRLREGVRFHDGTPLDAEAVRFNFERMLDPEHPYHDTGPFPLAQVFFGKLARVEAPDPLTVRLVLDEPFAPLLANLAYGTGLLVSPTAVRRHGADFGRHPAGTGPFRFAAWEARRRVVLERNPDYWGTPARAEAVVFRPVTDPVTRTAELLTGGIDIALELPPDTVAVLREAGDVRVAEAVGPHLWFLILNRREGPFADLRMRRAVNLAIDKRALVREVLQDTAVTADGPVPAAFAWAHDPNLQSYPHDPQRARELVEKAGYGDGAEVTFYVPQSGSGMLDPVRMAEAIQADLAAVGIRARIETFEWNTYLARVNQGLAGQADMAEMAWMTNDPDTLPYLALRSGAWPEQGGFNSGYYANPEADRLIEAARRTTDRTERARLYRELQRQVVADAPWAFIASWRQSAVSRARVEGLRLEPSFFLHLAGVHKEPAP